MPDFMLISFNTLFFLSFFSFVTFSYFTIALCRNSVILIYIGIFFLIILPVPKVAPLLS